MRVAIRVALLALVAACAAPEDVAGASDTPSVTGTSVVGAPTPSSTSTTSTATTTIPAETTTTTSPHRELTIRGTGKVYTLEESQAFGEFGPFLWNLVTTIHHKDAIEHHPRHEWVIWGPLWGGHIYDPTRSHDVYGVTDLDAIGPEEVASAVPANTTIILREVPWALDDLKAFGPELLDLVSNQVGQSICEMDTRNGYGFILEVAASRLPYVEGLIRDSGLPPEAVMIEVSDDCPRIRYLPPWEGPVDRPPRSAII